MDTNNSIERDGTSLVETIQKMMKEQPPSTECCIYRVPKLLRRLNPEAYTPMGATIGPLHYKVHDPEFNSNRLCKLKCLKSFLQQSERYNRHHNLDYYMNTVKGSINATRYCYASSDNIFNDDDEIFTEMVLLDCVYIIQLFREHSQHWKNDQPRSISMAPLKLKEIASDLLLAENQLPLFTLNELYGLAFPQAQDQGNPSFIDVACEFLEIDRKKAENGSIPSHLLQMLRLSLLPPTFQATDDRFLQTTWKTQDNKGIDLRKVMSPTATGLFEAGIKFKVHENAYIYTAYSILDIRFHVEKGILYIPKLWVEHGAERKFRNLIAFEQSHTADFTYITDYQFFLDCLINTPTDVQLLTEAGIIENWVGSEKNLSELINSMGKHAYHFRGGYLYSGIAKELNKYHKKKWYRYKAILRQVYFSHPWAIIPVSYAVVLLILTILQVVVGVLAMPPSNDKQPRNNC